jgi:hypothetical protein
MDGAGTTLREMSMKHIDNRGNALFRSMEHTNIHGVYVLLFDETNTLQVDIFLATIDESLDALSEWDNADAHFRYHSNEKVNIVGIVGIHPRGKQTDFWKKHFAGFVKATIPTEIDTAHLHQPPKSRKNNHAQPSYIDISRSHGHADNYGEVTSPIASKTATQQTRPSPMTQESLQQHADPNTPPPVKAPCLA